MQAVLARLEGSPALTLGSDPVAVRRSHRIPVAREDAPMVHLIDGADTPRPAKSNCHTERVKAFIVSVFIRDDAGAGVADPLVTEINSRLDPDSKAFTAFRGDLKHGAITPDEEIADADAVRIDMAFTFEYSTTGWSLE